MIYNRECPICGCKEIGQEKHYAQGSMYPIKGLFLLIYLRHIIFSHMPK